MKISSKASTFGIIVLLALIAFRLYTTKAAPSPTQFWTPGCVATIPKAWGQFKGGDAQSGLAFEDNAGTLRFLTNIPAAELPRSLSKFAAARQLVPSSTRIPASANVTTSAAPDPWLPPPLVLFNSAGFSLRYK
jgi:hypothetical protein